jgi:hypothetical protein
VRCKGPLELAQQLRFLVETDNLDNPSFLKRIRELPSVNGRPVPVCKACQSELKTAPRPPARPKAAPLAVAGLLGVFGALSVGLLLGGLFAPRG